MGTQIRAASLIRVFTPKLLNLVLAATVVGAPSRLSLGGVGSVPQVFARVAIVLAVTSATAAVAVTAAATATAPSAAATACTTRDVAEGVTVVIAPLRPSTTHSSECRATVAVACFPICHSNRVLCCFASFHNTFWHKLSRAFSGHWGQ